MILSAGFVTTGVIGNAVRALLAHPDQLRLVDGRHPGARSSR
jgi:hypothetical protein